MKGSIQKKKAGHITSTDEENTDEMLWQEILISTKKKYYKRTYNFRIKFFLASFS